MSNYKYRIRYERTGSNGVMVPCVTDIYGVSPMGALNTFHRKMQLEKETDGNRNVIRPKLGPKDYRILGLSQIYSSSARSSPSSEFIESGYDLPPNPVNPDLTKEPKQEAGELMPFMKGLSNGRLSE